MKNILFAALVLLIFVSCEKKQINDERNEASGTEQDAVETIPENNHNEQNAGGTTQERNRLAGGWYKEWRYRGGPKAVTEIDPREVDANHMSPQVLHLNPGGDYVGLHGLFDGGSAYRGSWRYNDPDLILQGFLDDETDEQPEFSQTYKIVAHENNVLYAQTGDTIEKWTKVDLNLMYGFIYWDFEEIKSYVDTNTHPLLFYERTPLMCSIYWPRSRDLIEYLIEKETFINAVDSFGKNAAHYVVEKYSHDNLDDKKQALDLLMKLKHRGIDFNARDIYGNTPFDYFESDMLKQEIDLLLEEHK